MLNDSSVHIIEADHIHLDDVISLWHELMQFHTELDQSFTAHPTAELAYRTYATEHINDDHGKLWIAYVRDTAIGYVMAQVQQLPPVFLLDRCILLQDLLVVPQYRRMGVGRALTRKVIDWSSGIGENLVQLHVASNNQAGIKFWEEMGFHEYIKLMRLDLKHEKTKRRNKNSMPRS